MFRVFHHMWRQHIKGEEIGDLWFFLIWTRGFNHIWVNYTFSWQEIVSNFFFGINKFDFVFPRNNWNCTQGLYWLAQSNLGHLFYSLASIEELFALQKDCTVSLPWQLFDFYQVQKNQYLLVFLGLRIDDNIRLG